MSLLEVEKLTVHDVLTGEALVKAMMFRVDANQCLGIIGASGGGKSLTCKAVLGLTPHGLKIDGQVIFDGQNLLTLEREKLRRIRGRRIGAIFQNAMTAFEPLAPLESQMVETLCEINDVKRSNARNQALEALAKVGFREPSVVMRQYPCQLSGGMLQRCMIAIVMASRPELIIADEPTSALDSFNQQEVLKAFLHLRQVCRSAMIYVSHDLGIIRRVADQVVVIQQGRSVEFGMAEQIFSDPRHEYTRKLIAAQKSVSQPFEAALGRGWNANVGSQQYC